MYVRYTCIYVYMHIRDMTISNKNKQNQQNKLIAVSFGDAEMNTGIVGTKTHKKLK
jgi:hypothetical protein